MLKFAGVLTAFVLIVISYVNAASAAEEAHPNGTGLFVSADYNYKKLDEDASWIVEPNWDSGFNVSLGYKEPDGGWDVLCKYTYYRTSSDDTITGYARTSVTEFTSVDKSEYGLDEAGLEAGYTFEVAKSLNLSPHIGAQYTRIEKQTTNRTNIITLTPPPPTNFNGQSKEIMEFQGYGLSAGADFDYTLGWDLHLSGGISGGFLAGSIEISRTISISTSPIISSLNWDDDEIVPMYAANLGLNYDLIVRKAVCLNISAGYEFGEYFNLSDPKYVFNGVYVLPTGEHDNYTLHGPYFRALLNF